MTIEEKQCLLAALDSCVRHDLFTKSETDLIMQICSAALERALSAAKEGRP